MKLKNLKFPLNTAIAAVGMILFVYSICAVVLSCLWQNSADGSLFCVVFFAATALVLLVFAAVSLRENSKRTVRDRFKLLSIVPAAAAVLVIAGLELYNGYNLNTVNVKRKRLHELYYGELDEVKLCTNLLSGTDPAQEPYNSGSVEDILKGGVPRFKGVYTGDLGNSFGDGGKIYLKLGTYAVEQMRKARAAKDSGAYIKAVELAVKINRNAAAAVNDPANSGVKLGRLFVLALQETVDTDFPADDDFEKLAEEVSSLRESFEYSSFGNVICFTSSILGNFDRLLADNSGIGKMLDRSGAPLWSERELFAGRLFPSARRSRLIKDYQECISAMNLLRGVTSSSTITVKKKIDYLISNAADLRKKKCFVTLALTPELNGRVFEVGAVQRMLEGAHLAIEVEAYRRRHKKMPQSLENVAGGRLLSLPVCHIDGAPYELVKGKFKSASGVYSGYAVKTQAGSFVIVEKR